MKAILISLRVTAGVACGLSFKIIQRMDSDNGSHTVIIEDGTDVYIVDHFDVWYIESESVYSTFYFEDRPPIISRKGLGAYEADLEPKIFHRIGRSHILNITKIEFYQMKGEGLVRFKKGNGMFTDKKQFYAVKEHRPEMDRKVREYHKRPVKAGA